MASFMSLTCPSLTQQSTKKKPLRGFAFILNGEKPHRLSLLISRYCGFLLLSIIEIKGGDLMSNVTLWGACGTALTCKIEEQPSQAC